MARDTSGAGGPRYGRPEIPARTLRTDRWWVPPLVTAVVLVAFVVYASWAAFVGRDYFAEPYLSPFYSPCLATSCARTGAPHVGLFGSWWPVSPAVIVLVVPLGFRLTCYYYRKAYYRAFWQAPPSCAVGEPHRRYTGEARFPLVLHNAHRYFLYLGLALNVVLTYDAAIAFRDRSGHWGHMGLGTLVLLVNAALLWAYSLSCHSCRHLVGGRLRHFSRHPRRYWIWTQVSRWNRYHMQIAWVSLVFVALADLYVRLVASGTISDVRFF
jgi:hypothetical protein